MFFLETFRYRSLVPPLEEDMPVAIGYVVLVIRGLSSDKALRLLEGRGARSVVTYGLMMLFTLFGLTGCARNNMREQDVYKSTEVSANYPPPNSLRMPSVDEASVPAPPPFDKLTKGDVNNFTKYQAYKATVLALNYDNGLNKNADKAANKIAIDDAKKNADFFEAQLKAKHLFPALYEVKDKNAVPPEMANWSSPVKADPASLHRGEILFNTNCSGCHGVDGLGDGGVGAVEYARPAPIGNGKNNMVVKDDENRGGQNVTLQNYTSYKDNYFYYYISTGKNLMPPFGYRLSPREICDIINHLHKLQGRPAQ
jgi:mono/diheme cytochrome c family protein